MYSQFSGFKIHSISTVCPSSISTNEIIGDLSKEESERLAVNIGITSKYVSKTEGEGLLELFYKASKRSLEIANVESSEVGLVVVLSQSSDLGSPGISSRLHEKLSLSKDVLVFDVNLGCSGYVKGLHIAMSLMKANGISKGMVLVGDVLSTFEMDEKKLRPLFGDGVSSTVLEYSTLFETSKVSFELGSDGKGWKAITISKTNPPVLEMSGLDVMTFALREVPESINKNLEKSGFTLNDIDTVVLHQANSLINTALERKIKRTDLPRALKEFGNTSGSSIPLVLTTVLGNEYFSQNRKIILSGFGIGLSWGSCIIDIQQGLKTSHELVTGN